MQNIFITGTSTDVGKTVVSAIVVQALGWTYWKPIQAGDLDNTDSMKVERYTEGITVLPEKFRLNEPMSPHAAAKLDGVQIDIKKLEKPKIDKLLIEGAGGILVPVNDQGESYADWLVQHNIPAIVVSRHYLGSINHSLLTLELLKSRGVAVEGIIFVGDENQETEQIIQNVSGVKLIARIPIAKEITKEFIQEQAEAIRATDWFINFVK